MNETRTNETVRLSKRLKANGRYFAFDSNANQLLPLDRPAHDLLPHFKRSGYASKRFNKRFSREAFSTGLENLENLWDRGFFRDRNNIELPFSNEYFKDKVGKKIQSFTLSLTENCNLRCKYCLFSGKSKGYREHSRKTMTLDTARKAVDFILKSTADIIEIGFYGGEPLLKLGLIKKIIDYVDLKNDDNRQVRFRMTTNGTLLTKSIADYLVRNDVLLSVSLDGPRKTHDRNRVFTNEAGSFEIVMKHLKYIKDTYPAYFSTITIIAVVVPPYDYKTLEDFFSQDSELFEQNKIILTDLEVERNDFFDEPEQRFVTKDKFVQKRNRYKKSLLSKLENPDCSLNLFQKTFISWYYSSFSSLFSKDKAKAPQFPRYCQPGCSKLYIDTDGKYYICENIPSTLSLGDVENGISSDKCHEISNRYMAVVGKKCLNCWAFKFCHLCLMDFLDMSNSRFIGTEDAQAKCNKVKRMVKEDFESFLNTVSKNPDAFELFA